MKRKRQESDKEQSSDDSLFKMTREIKAPKTQGYASPLTVINEDEPLDCSSVTEEDTKQVSDKRQTRATRAGTQAKRQQPKRGSRKKMPVANEEQTDSSSMDEKPRRITRNARKKLKDAAEISSMEEQPPQPVMEEITSSATKNSKESGEIVPENIVKQEPVSPVEETQPLRSTRNSSSGQEGANELTVPVPETPDLPAHAEKPPPASAKTCKATVHLVLQSPGFNFGNGANPVVTSSPRVEQAHHAGDVTVDDIVQSEKKDTTDGNNVVTESSLLPNAPQESLDTCRNEILKSESKRDLGFTGKKNHIESVISHEQNSDATEKIVLETGDDVNMTYQTGIKSGRRSTQRKSGWWRKSKRSSLCMSPGDRQQAVKKNKAKAPGKKSLVKSSVKLKLTQSKLMPELKLNGSVQINAEETSEPALEAVRVRLFDNLTSEFSTSSGSSAASPSSCSSTEDKADAPMEKLVEDDGDVVEVFHDCRATEIRDVDEAKSEQNAKTDRYAP